MNTINNDMLKEFGETFKVGLIGSVGDNEYPHISFITSLQALNEKEMISGQFISGLCGKYIEESKKMGFLIMSLGKKWWSGKALWKEKKHSGAEYEMYNNIPMFRYNSYFGIHTVHYYDLVEVSEGKPLEMFGIVMSALKNTMTKGKFADNGKEAVMKPWANKLLKGLATLKFICYYDSEGYPKLVPIIQAQACDSSRIVIPAKPYQEELKGLEKGAKVAIMGMNLDMESVLLKGEFGGFNDKGVGYMDITMVYNSMPPKHGYIYPDLLV